MDYKVTGSELTSVANSIRTKGGTSEPLTWPNGYVDAVGAIQAGGGGDLYPMTIRAYKPDNIAYYTATKQFSPSDTYAMTISAEVGE